MAAKGQVEYSALMNAMRDTEVPCTDDERFLMDDSDEKLLAHICAKCPVDIWCRDYALAAKPAGGVWAGRRFDKQKRTER